MNFSKWTSIPLLDQAAFMSKPVADVPIDVASVTTQSSTKTGGEANLQNAC
jgi:hypothetical protein